MCLPWIYSTFSAWFIPRSCVTMPGSLAAASVFYFNKSDACSWSWRHGIARSESWNQCWQSTTSIIIAFICNAPTTKRRHWYDINTDWVHMYDSNRQTLTVQKTRVKLKCLKYGQQVSGHLGSKTRHYNECVLGPKVTERPIMSVDIMGR